MFRSVGILFGIICLVAAVMGGSYLWDAYVIHPADEVESVVFEVESGSSVEAIAFKLEAQELIASTFFFKVYVKLSNNAASLQAGTFELLPGMNYRALVAELGHAEASESQVTIPEGFTVDQVGEVVIERFESVDEDSWNEIVGEQGRTMVAHSDVLGGVPNGQGLEGYLFPDTYRFRDDVDAKTVADTMVLTLKRRMAEGGVVIPSTLVFQNGMTLHELLTLASIVQREALTSDDMRVVAGIFLTRLQIGMALQADSTVNYITGKKDAAVTLVDSRISSPYNTYTTLGLPPGPISNPGIDAIMAVLEPNETDYLYFLTDLSGVAHFATNFDKHIENKYKYLK
jgi:UPF0755 protein